MKKCFAEINLRLSVFSLLPLLLSCASPPAIPRFFNSQIISRVGISEQYRKEDGNVQSGTERCRRLYRIPG